MTPEPPYVVTEPGLRKLVAQGWHVVVVAMENARLHNQHWRGDWRVRVARPDGGLEMVLVVSRTPNPERQFSMLSTVVNFLDKYGFATVHVPLRRGGRTVHVPVASWSED